MNIETRPLYNIIIYQKKTCNLAEKQGSCVTDLGHARVVDDSGDFIFVLKRDIA